MSAVDLKRELRQDQINLHVTTVRSQLHKTNNYTEAF